MTLGPADHQRFMREAILEAERARGGTGDNPWVGCVLVDEQGAIVARGHTQGPGEDHAEIVALQQARVRGIAGEAVTLYSTLEPCSFHGRTPACSRVILDHGVKRVVTGMRDPNPRVDGQGVAILRGGGIAVVEGVCEADVRRQLGVWVLAHHPHEVIGRAGALLRDHPRQEVARMLEDTYVLDRSSVVEVLSRVK